MPCRRSRLNRCHGNRRGAQTMEPQTFKLLNFTYGTWLRSGPEQNLTELQIIQCSNVITQNTQMFLVPLFRCQSVSPGTDGMVSIILLSHPGPEEHSSCTFWFILVLLSKLQMGRNVLVGVQCSPDGGLTDVSTYQTELWWTSKLFRWILN